MNRLISLRLTETVDSRPSMMMPCVPALEMVQLVIWTSVTLVAESAAPMAYSSRRPCRTVATTGQNRWGNVARTWY